MPGKPVINAVLCVYNDARFLPQAVESILTQTFRDFELQARTLKEALIPTLLEERAALDLSAQVTAAGHCPHCGSDRTCLEAQVTVKEIHSPDGEVVLQRQQARCRACGGSFSPSGS